MENKRWDGPRREFLPVYSDSTHWFDCGGFLCYWDGDPFYETDKSWFESTYIHSGISGYEQTITGPDAAKLLSDLVMNDVYKWRAGTCKHLVFLNEEGLIDDHVLYMKDSDDQYRTTAGVCFYPQVNAASGKYDVKITQKRAFVFQFSGPRSLTVIEKVTQTDLHDLKFLEFRSVKIPGFDGNFEGCRIGMSGTLGYEIRGEEVWGPDVYTACLVAGKEYGIKRLGWRDYTVNHTFGGFPQQTVHWEMALFEDPEFLKVARTAMHCTGSVDPANHRARHRTPVEVNWEWMAKFNHEFKGRAALEKEMSNPSRKIVTLEFNKEDIIDVYASQFTDHPYKFMDMPCAEPQQCGGHQDIVLKDGIEIGWSSVPTYSSHYHVTVSHCTMDIHGAEIGDEVIVKWGDFGGIQKDLRAIVRPFPYIRYKNDVQDNRGYDLSTVPNGSRQGESK